MYHYSVLAVDDEPFNLDLIEAAFSEYENVSLSFSTNALEALSLLEQKDFDVVLLDISMPKMDGMEVLKKIKEQEKFAQLPVLMVTANIEKERAALALGASDFITKPYDIDLLCTRTLNYAKLHCYTKQMQSQNKILEEKVRQRTADLEAALQLSKETEFEISTRLGRASESRDPETGGHIKRMSHYSQLLAKLAGLSDEEAELILYAAPLHDIGKIGIEDKVLLKPGPFNDDEFAIMKTHATIGAQMLEGAERFPILNAGKIIALEHHEKWDGTGYPHGIQGENIHLYARIVTIADVFDALSSKRCYKEPMELNKIIEILKRDSGKHFDPRLIELFLNNLDQFLEIQQIFQDENCLPFNKERVIQSYKNIHVLFVDDSELTRIMVQEMLLLVFPNIHITTLSHPDEVLRSNLSQYDVILSDINMPHFSGYELFEKLRQEHHYKKPIIAITAMNLAEDKAKILAHGFDDYIAKPININELENRLKKFI